MDDEFPTLNCCMSKLNVRLVEVQTGKTDVEKLKREAENDDIMASVKMYQTSQMGIFSKKRDLTATK